MVMNVGALRSGDQEAVKQDIHGRGPRPLIGLERF